MVCNYLITAASNKKNITNVILAISKITTELNNFVGKFNSISIAPLSVNTTYTPIAKGEMIISVKINVNELKSDFLGQFDKIISNVSSKYNVEIDKKEIC